MTNMLKIKEVLNNARHRLLTVTATPQLDAELLLSHMLKKTRTYLYAYGDEPLSPELQAKFERLLLERIKGVPIAYLLGEREFWSMDFYVTPDTLIPRPETEVLVELVLDLSRDQPECSILELGTGSGAISVALAKEKPKSQFLAVDKSEAALAIAEKNMIRHQVENIHLMFSDWFQAIPQTRFDFIISNPPYLETSSPYQHEGDLRFEPKSALLSGPLGTEDLELIISRSQAYLKPEGWLLFEHGFDQAKALREALQEAGYKNIQSWQDISGHERISGGMR